MEIPSQSEEGWVRTELYLVGEGYVPPEKGAAATQLRYDIPCGNVVH